MSTASKFTMLLLINRFSSIERDLARSMKPVLEKRSVLVYAGVAACFVNVFEPESEPDVPVQSAAARCQLQQLQNPLSARAATSVLDL